MALIRILVVDRDQESVDYIKRMQEDIGLVDVVFEPSKARAVELMQTEKFNAVFFDPAPETEDLRSFVIRARRENKNYVPITVISRHTQAHEALACGANDYLPKPLDIDDFKAKIKNMKNLTELITRLKEDHNDYASRDGVISKTAFYQIFTSCLDRADRYGEETYMIFVRIDNIHDLQGMYGDELAEQLCDKLKKYTVRIRRLSDVVGRTAINELCLMIVRPVNHNEPFMAVNRFADSMADYSDLICISDAKAHISVHMMALPTGKIMFSKECY